MSNRLLIDEVLSSTLLMAASRSDNFKVDGNVVNNDLFRFLLDSADRLAANTQFSEFTEHGLLHIASLVRRVSTWTTGRGQLLVDTLDPTEAAILAFAFVTHDLGMLSQNADDLPASERITSAQQFVDLPSWVRKTHVTRLPGLLRRLLSAHELLKQLPGNDTYECSVTLAMTHQEWPPRSSEAPKGPLFERLCKHGTSIGMSSERLMGLAAALAVCDLLDEDQSRCDIEALFGNKHATTLNRAHWLRHSLIAKPPTIERGIVEIELQPPSSYETEILCVSELMKYHLKQAELEYSHVLGLLGEDIPLTINIKVGASNNTPNVSELPYFSQALDTQLLRAFSSHEIIGLLNQLDMLGDSAPADLKRKLQFVLTLLPTDMDSMIGLRTLFLHGGKQKQIDNMKEQTRRDMLEFAQQGEIMRALKLVREYQYESN